MRRPSYEYQPLQHDDSIRLLILHPSPNESDPIACTIRHAQLSSTARYPKVYPAFFTYEAVSYTWGYSTQWTAISFNNGKEELSVGENCHAALRRLRKPTADRSIWIDAVCINQQDLTERSMQVRMMNEIYTRAIGIVVMLSDQVPDCRLLLDEAIIVNNLLRHTDVIPRGRPTKAIIRQLEVLFEDPWFKRTWVLQEVYKKYQIVIMYGSALIALPVLKQICYGYGNRKLTRGVLPRPLALVWGSETEYSTPQFNLWNRLYESRECLASNPRDKVFALKSLLGHRQSEIDNLIDYVQSVEQCFKRVAEFLLPVLGIRILAATRHPHEMGMASWIPDWSQDGPLQSTAFHFESDKARMLGNMSMSATAGDYERATKSCLYKDLPTGPELHVTGCRYARIVKSSQVFGFFDAEHAERQMQMVYNDFDNLRQRLQSRAKRKTTPFTLAHFGRKLFQVISRMNGMDLHHSLTRACGTYDKKIFLHEELEEFSQALQLCKISLLDNGELATVPSGARSRDVVCIFKGAVAPCVLRPARDASWKLVSGDCFMFATGLQSVSGVDAYIKLHLNEVEGFKLR